MNMLFSMSFMVFVCYDYEEEEEAACENDAKLFKMLFIPLLETDCEL